MKSDTPKHAKHDRNVTILNLYESGQTAYSLAKMLGITPWRVCKIIKDYRTKYVSPYIYLEDYDKPPTKDNYLPR